MWCAYSFGFAIFLMVMMMFHRLIRWFKRPKGRNCKTCYFSYKLRGIMHCSNTSVGTAYVEPNDFCMNYSPYEMPTEETVIKNYLERCFTKD